MQVRNAAGVFPEFVINRRNVATEPCTKGGNRTFKCTVDKSVMFVRASGIDQLQSFFGKRLKHCQVMAGVVANAVSLSELMS